MQLLTYRYLLRRYSPDHLPTIEFPQQVEVLDHETGESLFQYEWLQKDMTYRYAELAAVAWLGKNVTVVRTNSSQFLNMIPEPIRLKNTSLVITALNSFRIITPS